MKLFQYYASMSPVYKNGYSNHGPMMIEAYRQLGVDDKLIKKRLDYYFQERSIGDLGDKFYPKSTFESNYVSRTNYYMDQFHEKSVDVVVSSLLNQSSDALSSALFHGVIRLAYATLSNQELLIAQALAYFELSQESKNITYQEIPLNEWSEHIDLLVQIRFDLKQTSNDIKLSDFDTLLKQDRIKNNIKVPRLYSSVKNIIDTISNRYLDTSDFVVLHTLTGFHALLLLKDYFADFNHTLKQYLAVAQVYMVLHSYDNDSKIKPPSIAMDELKSQAYMLKDAHDVKLFYTAYDLYQKYELQSLHQICERLITTI